MPSFLAACLYDISLSLQTFLDTGMIPGVRRLPSFVAGLDVRNTSFALSVFVAGVKYLGIRKHAVLRCRPGRRYRLDAARDAGLFPI